MSINTLTEAIEALENALHFEQFREICIKDALDFLKRLEAEQTIRIWQAPSGKWQAIGNYLDHGCAVVEDGLYECLTELREQVWDAEITRDTKAGKLDALIAEADAEYEQMYAAQPSKPSEEPGNV